MPLVPPDSPLRQVPDSIDRRSVLYLDGIRYCFHIFDLASARLVTALQALSTSYVSPQLLADQIATAISDAWTMVDTVHRLRELLSQAPRLKKNSPELQLFIRHTSKIEDLRHFYQHFRTRIDSFASIGMPLWGTLSWIHTDLATGENHNYTIAPGTFFEGATVYSCTVDFVEMKYVERIALFAGSAMVDLAVLAEQVEQFTAWYTTWYQKQFPDVSHHAADLHIRTGVRAVQRKPAADIGTSNDHTPEA